MEDVAADPSWAGEALEALTAELTLAFRRWEGRPETWGSGVVDELARRAFAIQHAGNEPYRRYCDRMGVATDAVGSWRDVPPVPTAAFRAVRLVVGEAGPEALEFWTSGTTGGPERRGRHLVPSAEIYRASLEATFRRFVIDRAAGDASGRLPVGSLISGFAAAPHSSLSWMADAVLAAFGDEGSRVLSTDAGIDWERADGFVRLAEAEGVAVCLLGTTLAFDEWMRRLEGAGRRVSLPAGSVVMDTGGSKGRHGLSRARVTEALERQLEIPHSHVINEFGMTELLTQRYDTPGPHGSASERERGERGGEDGPSAAERLLRGPPWLLSRALDPMTLKELPDGHVGVLNHFDLANVGSVCSVLTEDLGAVEGNAIRWVGRTPGSPPRGCSLATAELLSAQAHGAEP